MNSSRYIFAALAAVVVLPFAASAHERHVFEINGESYQFVVGSLNEPLVVDDKSGVELIVTMPEHSTMAANDHHGEGGAVTGLQETLKVELIAGDKKKVMDFSTIYGTPGGYKAPFFPTVATTLSYRVFCTIANTPFDYTFTCSPAGHTAATEDTSRVEVSENVVRTLKTGSFGCPSPKADLGFPEPSADVQALRQQEGGDMVGYGAGILALAALGLAVMRRKV